MLLNSSLIIALFFTFLAQIAKFNVEIVSGLFESEGLIFPIIEVFALPPKLSFKNKVNLESL